MNIQLCMLRVVVLIALFARTDYSFAAMTQVNLPATGAQPTVITPQGKAVPLYTASYALLISASDYLGAGQGGWRKLESTASEMDRVATTLRNHGFNVLRVSNPGSEELTGVFRKFIASYGHDKNNRLLFFFAGHGYTNPRNNFGYLVPVDAKSPDISSSEFFNKALPISTITVWAREIEARHALFFFDSCFSGSIFAVRGSPSKPEPMQVSPDDRWRFLVERSQKPVRQFVAAGGPNEELPSRSEFVPVLLRALDGYASNSRDGFITGKEIGLYLEQTIPSLVKNQNPHSGVIPDSEFAFGDMIFQVPNTNAPQQNPVQPSVIPRPTDQNSPAIGSRSNGLDMRLSTTPIQNVTDKKNFVGIIELQTEYDKVTFPEESKSKLDRFLLAIKDVDIGAIVFTGHTIDFGPATQTQAYRTKLSEQRAVAIKDYLVNYKGTRECGVYPGRDVM